MPLLPRPRRSGQSTHTLPGGLAALYAPPAWALFTEVRSATGPHDVLRIADAIAVDTLERPRWRIHGFELKRDRKDWVREREDPAKSAPLRLFCAAWYLVTPAPWKRVVLSLRELPARWGLIEIGTGGAQVVQPAPERDAEEPSAPFLQALLRAAARSAEDRRAALRSAEDRVPQVEITRPGLSRERVGLACGHTAARPLAKALPRAAPCWSCADGQPTDRELVEAAIRDASEDDRARCSAPPPRAPRTRASASTQHEPRGGHEQAAAPDGTRDRREGPRLFCGRGPTPPCGWSHVKRGPVRRLGPHARSPGKGSAAPPPRALR